MSRFEYDQRLAQVETEVARVAESDEDCRRLMTHAGIGPFLAVAKVQGGDDAKRFPTKKHLCSYAGVVPGSDKRRARCKGKANQDAEVAAARKLACIVWKILTSKQPYVEENEYLTARKMARTASIAKRTIPNAMQPESVPGLAKELVPHAEQWLHAAPLRLRKS